MLVYYIVDLAYQLHFSICILQVHDKQPVAAVDSELNMHKS